MSVSIPKAPSDVASPMPVGASRSWVDPLRALGELCQDTRPADRVGVAHLWILASLVLCGAFVRFWGLGAVGLHGDEETMAMAAKHILIDGKTTLPSGMFYPRGMTQLYLMAASIAMFGESEWALRLPSALCGILLIPVAYFAARRFLRAEWSLAVAAAVAFLPELIVYSQTARMYIFMVTAIMGAMVCIFRWERTNRLRWLVGAVAALIFGLDMQLLTVAAILVFLLPGIVQGDARKLLQGSVAAVVVAIAFVLMDLWVSSHYATPPSDFADAFGPRPPRQSEALRDFATTFDIALTAIGVIAAIFAWRAGRAARGSIGTLVAAAVLVIGVGLQVILYYHLAALFYAAGLVLAARQGELSRTRLVIFIGCVAALAAFHIALLSLQSPSIVRLVGALVGEPSVWPYVRVAQLSPVAGILVALVIAWGAYRLARRERAADYWVLALLGVWAPVFALGLFAWNVPSRYTAMCLPALLICAFAAVQATVDWLKPQLSAQRVSRATALLAPISALAVINPVATASTVNAGYRTHPDHKGAAEFLRAYGLKDEDIVLAEDVLQQTYYLGGVDYWLIGPQVARRFVMRSDEGVVDFYTGTPVIVTPAMLDELLASNRDKRIFVIGTGEGWVKGVRTVREDLHPVIESSRFETLYVGRDGLTRVLRAVPGAVQPSSHTEAKSKADEKALERDAPPAGVKAQEKSESKLAPALEE